jgi:hypothetical protein
MDLVLREPPEVGRLECEAAVVEHHQHGCTASTDGNADFRRQDVDVVVAEALHRIQVGAERKEPAREIRDGERRLERKGVVAPCRSPNIGMSMLVCPSALCVVQACWLVLSSAR